MQITEFCSREGEFVPLQRAVEMENELEMWLRDLEEGMKSTLASLLTECSMGSGDISTHPGQILTLREAIRFSEKVERAIKTGKLSLLHRELQVCCAIWNSKYHILGFNVPI